MKLLMSTKAQFKMYLDADVIDRLNQLAVRFSRDSKQAVVEELISIYLPTWIAVNESMRRAVEYQAHKITQEGELSANAFVPVSSQSRSKAIPKLKQNEPRKRRAK